MELRRLDEKPVLKRKEIRKNPFLTAVQEGFRTGGIDADTFQRLNAGIASIVSKLIKKYTCGDSSSVKDETASLILCSVYYTVDAYLNSLGGECDLYSVLCAENINDIYEKGILEIKDCFDKVKSLFKEISENKLVVPLAPYNDLIDEAIPEFLKNYDIEFGATDSVCSIDYPLVFDEIRDEGVFYIYKYLEQLKIETEFCRLFSHKLISKVLYGYQKKYKLDVVNSPLNLFIILADQLIFSVLAGNKNMDFTVTADGFEKTVKRLSGKDQKMIKLILSAAVRKITTVLKIRDDRLIKLMERYQHQYADRLIFAVGNGNAENLVIIEGDDQNRGKAVFKDGVPLEDAEFIQVLAKIEECEDIDEVIGIIRDKIHSIKDLIDVLEADCFFDSEFNMLFKTFDDTELALLGTNVFFEQLRAGGVKLTDAFIEKVNSTAERDWQRYYLEYIKELDDGRKSSIETLVNSIVCDSLE
ncbi:MAG: DUF6179 domain-containing protein [Bacillota bacterium]|nr:DUF6179 domain-containing protein [Bacillota bacterium]